MHTELKALYRAVQYRYKYCCIVVYKCMYMCVLVKNGLTCKFSKELFVLEIQKT